MALTPEAIFNDVQRELLDKETATELLLSLIDNAESMQIRILSMKYLIKLKARSPKVYKILENTCISDSNDKVRIQAAQTLMDLHAERALPLMKWLLFNEKSLIILISITKMVGEIKSQQARAILLKKFAEINKKKYKYNIR
ncbi:MAG: hypothetical protein ACTSYC_12650, partial [Promethearchaeota archaeon]